MSSASSTEERATVATLAALSAAAWAALWAWGASPYADWLDHDEVAEIASVESWVVAAAVGGWTLMIVAMMLPTSLALVVTFRRVVARRGDARRLVARLVWGYVLTWGVVGAALHSGDLVLHEAVDEVGWLAANEWSIGAATLALAGAYQLSPLKGRCLTKCRSPRMFVLQRWRGRDAAREAFRLGVDHGLFCVGCCWALMLLIFAAGVGNLAWMLVLGTIMAIEKNVSWGARLTTPLGAVLLASAGAVALVSL